jgi:AraC family transcriptional regulator
MAYLRARRLSRSAAALAQGAPDILQVALEAGYSSHEAFSRAFRDQFEATPEGVRERGSTAGLNLTMPADLSRSGVRERPRSRIVSEPVIRVVGLSAAFPRGPSLAITSLWQQFASYMDAIPAAKITMPVGVAYNFMEDGGFDYLAALEVSTFGDTPSDLTQMEIPARRYAVFTHTAHVARIHDTVRVVWDEMLPAMKLKPAEATTLERHLPAFNPLTGEGGVDVWIPLEG